MLKADTTPEAEARVGNIDELRNAAAEAAERGETLSDFLDHAALVADADSVDERAPVSLLTMHNAKGLEFPVVFIAGFEDGLFPHSRSLESFGAIEEERRLCYVAMTRAEKKLYLTRAATRRRYGGGEYQRTKASQFLKEVPRQFLEILRDEAPAPDEQDQVDLYSERWEVRETVKRNLYTGKTYNSIENISQYFAERGMKMPSMVPSARTGQQPPPRAASPPPAAAQPQGPRPAPQIGKPLTQAPPPSRKKGFGPGSTIRHPKYGRGTVMRREGDGDDAKLTVSFPGYGLKKIIEKYAGIKEE
jgi:DNA helicase-2/ATP-dependent DNA helicase PcrA